MSDIPREQLEQLWRDYGCLACVHYRAKTTSCDAFPEGIPVEVASGQVSHLDPLDGDHGIRFEPKSEFLGSMRGTTDDVDESSAAKSLMATHGTIEYAGEYLVWDPVLKRYFPCRDERGRFASCGGAVVPPKKRIKAARKKIHEARQRQRAKNAAAAKAKPVHSLGHKESQDLGIARHHAEFCRREITGIEKGMADHKAEWDKVSARRKLVVDKMYDYSLSKPTRRKYEKELKEIEPRHNELRDIVEFGPDRKAYWTKQEAKARDEVARLEADPTHRTEITINYGDLHQRHPDLIAPGHIADRIKDYEIGDVKAEVVKEIASHYEAEQNYLAARRSKLHNEMADLIAKQGELVNRHVAESLEIPPALQAKVDRIQKRLDKVAGQHARVMIQQKSIERRRREEVARTLEVEPGSGLKFVHADVPDGYQSSNAALGPLGDMNKTRASEAESWLGRLTAKGDTSEIIARIGEAPNARAHFNNTRDHMQISAAESTDVIVHEYGHAIEYRLKTGEQRAVDRSLEFLKHRVGDERPVDLKEKFGVGDPGEMGRKDRFTSIYSDYSAHYTGKDYGRDATEIASMGLQKLYNDPAGFAKNDPEYFKFVTGILDGSLR